MIKVRRIYTTRGDGTFQPTTRVKVLNLKVEERQLHEASSVAQAAIARAQAKFNADRVSPKPVGPPNRIMRDPGHCPVETIVYWSATAVFATFVVSLFLL